MKICTLRARLCVLALACAIASFSFAQTLPSTDTQTTGPRLKEIVVTASRMPTRTDELVSDVTVIDRALIESSTAKTLPELLTREAGVQMSSQGGAGLLSSVFIRGTDSRHTILLIDGVRYGSVTVGTPIWDNIPMDMIERIEVLRGPGSALYGADGAGGVVQIFTRKGQAGFHPYASLTAGSKGYNQGGVGFSGGQGAVSYSLALQSQRQTGFSATNVNDPFGNFNPDNDGFKQDALNGSVAWQLNPNWRVDASALQSDGVVHLDDGLGRDARTALRTQVTQLGVKGQVLPNWQTELRFAQSMDKSEAVVASSFLFPSLFTTTQNQISWQNNVNTPVGVVTLGAEQLVQSIDSTTLYTVSERTINAYFLGLNGNAGAHSWQLNVRNDSNSQFGKNTTSFAGYGFKVSDQWRISASQGTSFVAPSFNQLYFPGFGSPTLQPERGTNTDLSLSYNAGVHQVKLTRMDNKIRGYITNTTLAANIPRARIDGWTLGYSGTWDKLTLRANLDTLDPRNELNNKLLARRAKEQLTLGADYNWGRYSLGGSVLAVGRRFDNTANTTELAGYTTADMYVGLDLDKNWQLQAKLNNLSNKVYETAYGYNQPGRGVFLTLKYAPK